MSRVHVVSFCNLIGTAAEVDNFSRGCYQAFEGLPSRILSKSAQT